MKLFQQLLVAPAALGLLAPLAANAAEVNINDVANYATTGAEVTTAQYSDVVPGDWAYTALQNLSESYGCVDNAYTQNLKSGQALTRYEAAALINACLEGGLASADVDSDAVRLSNEFGTEMAILKGRVDGLEYKVKELSAGQFSSTTKMSGGAVFTTGFVDGPSSKDDNKLATEYNFTVDLNTSFNGRDGLYAQVVQGNQSELVLESSETDSTLTVGSLYYSFPVGDFQVTAGPLVDQDDVISASTSIYSENFRLDTMRFSAAGTETGPGVAVAYANDSGFNGSVSYVAQDGENGTKGMFSREGDDVLTASLGYDADNFGGGILYKNADNNGDTNGEKTFGVGAYFAPENLPTISVAYDTKDPETVSTTTNPTGKNSSALTIGLDYEVGPGTASLAWQSFEDASISSYKTQTLSNYELYYSYPVSDGIDVQGGLFYEEGNGRQADTVGYIVETFFSF
ncbi:iron uptake porin [Prochlorococcus marinus]|uniref:iron uptake porin n=1 Tax=Prochlorococcus marinus TaxID=1219 RepID=UPI0022B46716|nr:iron uptake porin [Prochlorococcus marinus]